MAGQTAATTNTALQETAGGGRIVEQTTPAKGRGAFSPHNRRDGTGFVPRSRSYVTGVNSNTARERPANLGGVVAKNNAGSSERTPPSTRSARPRITSQRPARYTRYAQQARRMALQGAIDPTEIERDIIHAARNLAGKLNKEIEMGNDTGAFMIALSLAVAKDLLDLGFTFVGIGLIPGVNFAVGLFLSTFLFFFMLGKGWMRKFRLKIKFWILGLFVDGLPAFSVLPINSLLVLDAWRRVRKRAKKAEVKMRNLSRLTQQEIHELNENVEEALDKAREE